MSATGAFAVLLVEDTRSDADLALHALEREGLATMARWVQDGRMAVELLLAEGAEAVREEIRLVLLDINLPCLSGIEVLRLIKEHPHARRIPVVMLSSSGAARDVGTCYALGANGYIIKPADIAGYGAAVLDAVRYWTSVNSSFTESGKVCRPPGA